MRIWDNPEHWQNRAEEARAIADGLNAPIAKRTMQEITEGYLRLAERAEARFRREAVAEVIRLSGQSC
jgi:hypothetical protein